MTSKLIERLINKEYLTERERKEWLGIVKKHLEVLENIIEKAEEIEQENLILKNDNHQLDHINKERLNKLHELEKEKSSFLLTIKCLHSKTEQLELYIQRLEQQNEKLKKAIEILKDKLTIEIKQHICSDSYYLDYSDYCYVDTNLTQQEYDLLKEVLGE